MVIEEHVVNKIVESVKQRLGDESRNYRDGSLAIAFDPLIPQPHVGNPREIKGMGLKFLQEPLL